MATLQMIAAMGAIAAGSWEYWSGSKDLKNMRAFLVASKYVVVLYSHHCNTTILMFMS
ncbi:hypothetical protein BD410DRAFT_785857 [Rickenella mellea]|uniref:Uncharacterized protein n=1 Tax=Rickenella mellea TaxID=50990 RepID=A0A4Y7QDA1_9AGAM|nr:hypothetical protein BD410DRAFT_785857 [Rickenella mellea]